MRILYLIKADQIGGAEIQLSDIINFFHNKFERIIVGSYSNNFKKVCNPDNVSQIELLKSNILMEILVNLRTINGILLKERIDVVHYFHRIFLPLILIIKIKYPSIKVIYSATSVFKDLRGYFVTADYYLAVSNPVFNNLIGFYKRNRSKVYQIAHGVDLKKYPFIGSNYLEKSDTKLRLGYAGRLEKSKGIKYLILLMDQLREYMIELRIQGSGSQRSYLINLSRRLNLADKIMFCDWNKDIREFLLNIDVLILPSIKFEGFGLILLEAMASGKIVIASDTGGISEIIRHNSNGFLVRPKDVQDLKKYILDIYNHSVNYPAIKEAVLNTVKVFNLGLKLIEYENFYKLVENSKTE